MKFFYTLLILLLVLAAPGCSWRERTVATVVRAEVATGTQAIQAFVDYEKQHGMDADTRRKVGEVYKKFVDSNLALKDSWIAYKRAKESASPDLPQRDKEWNALKSAVVANETELIALVKSIIK